MKPVAAWRTDERRGLRPIEFVAGDALRLSALVMTRSWDRATE